MISIFKKIGGKIGVDGAVALTVLTRVIQAFGGVISLVFIAKFLSAKEQGYYYTFASIIAIQVFFELGLSGIITQYTAHEFVHLSWDEQGLLIGEENYKSRLSSLLRFCIKWFGIISLLLLVLLVIVGFYFFLNYNHNEVADWKSPWLLLCVATAMNLFIDPLLSFYEGLGDVKDMAKLRLIQKGLFLVFLFIFFALGFKLFSSPLASLLSVSVNYLQILLSKRLRILKEIWHNLFSEKIDYMKEIFPYQWRIALSWISGYFIFQLFNPVLFATQGAKVAGQMGMTMQALNGVSALSMSWITTKIPLMSSYIAKKDFAQLDKVFNATVKQLVGVNFLSMAFLFSAIWCLNYLKLPVSERFLPLLPLGLLCLVTFFNQYVFSWATYLRCHKQEPFLIISIIAGILCTLSTLIFGSLFGLYGIVIGYSVITMGFGVPAAYYIFKTKKAEWHS